MINNQNQIIQYLKKQYDLHTNLGYYVHFSDGKAYRWYKASKDEVIFEEYFYYFLLVVLNVFV